VVFRPVLAFRDLLFIHASTNATDDHKYSPLPSADFDSSGVLVSFSEFVFSENKAQEMTPNLLALAKVCSVLGNIRDVSWHLSKRGRELEKKVTIFHFGKNGAHKKKPVLVGGQ